MTTLRAISSFCLCLLVASVFSCGLTSGIAVAADYSNQEPADFVASVFPGLKPHVKVLWITPDIRMAVVRILGHEPVQLRQKYWTDSQKTVWIFDEIGKEDSITAGFVVKDGRIEQARVLTYRESRGGEIRYPSFISQFQGVALSADTHLNRRIDGISGATLSVNAMTRMTREALYFAQVVAEK